jgi:hypothetical protein
MKVGLCVYAGDAKFRLRNGGDDLVLLIDRVAPATPMVFQDKRNYPAGLEPGEAIQPKLFTDGLEERSYLMCRNRGILLKARTRLCLETKECLVANEFPALVMRGRVAIGEASSW